jgi:glycosyltransferase involved in cell wall biosynthesis
MKTIAIDASKIADPTKTGVESVVENLIKGILLADTANTYVLYTPYPLPESYLRSKNVKERIVPAGRGWGSFRLGWALIQDRPDIFWQPSNILPFILPPGTKVVMTIHDLAPFIVPEAFSWKAPFAAFLMILQARLTRATLVAISETTGEDLKDIFGIGGEKVVVISNAAVKGNKQDAESFPLGFEKFFLFVGRIELRKNMLRLIRAFAKFKETDKEQTYLILAGKPGFGYERILAEMTRMQVQPFIIVTGYLPQSQLEGLWQRTIALVFPTLWEGFGIPILEAFLRDVPVITGKEGGGATSEVAGESAYLVDVQNETAIAEALTDVATDKELREELVSRGRKRINVYSWEKSAVDYVELFGRL